MSALTNRGQRRQAQRAHLSLGVAMMVNLAITLLFLQLSEHMWHWFLLPTFLCSVLITPDIVRWLSGEYDLFDPKGILGIYGWYFFFLAPMIFVLLNRGISYPDNPSDWRPWVGLLALIHIPSLLAFQLAQRWAFQKAALRPNKPWIIDPDAAAPLIILFVGIALAAQSYYFLQIGGISGIIAIADSVRTTGQAVFTGLGVPQLIGEALPLTILVALTILRTRSKVLSELPHGTALGFVFALTSFQFLLGGFSGSRSTTVWSTFWMAAIIHQFWRRFRRSEILIGALVILLFLYIYGFYKGGGIDAINQLAEGDAISRVESDTNRSFTGLLIGDLARVDVQSYVLYKLHRVTDYDLRWGATYTEGIARRVLPTWIWANRPPDSAKVQAGTELFLGRASYTPGDWFRNVLRVYGISGEAMLNFGPAAVPFAFALWGGLVGWFRRATAEWNVMDARRFMAPLGTLLLIATLFSDIDNIAASAISKGTYISVVLIALVTVSRFKALHWRSRRKHTARQT